MDISDIQSAALIKALVAVGLCLGLIWLAGFLLERTLDGASKALKMAFKAEFTTDAGRLNAVLMFLITFLVVFSNLHEMLGAALQVEHGAHDHGLVSVVLCGIFFMGSLFSVMLLERKK